MNRRFVLLFGTALLATAVAAAYGGSPLGGGTAPPQAQVAPDGSAPCERLLRVGYRAFRVGHVRFFGPPCDG